MNPWLPLVYYNNRKKEEPRVENFNGKWSRTQTLFTVQHERGSVYFLFNSFTFFYFNATQILGHPVHPKNAPDYFSSRDKTSDNYG